MSKKERPREAKETSSRLFGRWKTSIKRGYKAFATRHPSISLTPQALKNFSQHQMTLSSAYFAYHCFMAIFPLLLLISSILGFVLKSDPALQQKILKHVYDILPDFGGTLKSALNAMVTSRHLVGIIGLVGILWTGTRITRSLDIGTNIIWGTERRSFWKRKLVSLGTLLLLGVLGLLALGLSFATSSLLSWISQHASTVWTVVSFIVGTLVTLLVTFLIFATIYVIIPQQKPKFRDAAKGAIVAAILFHLFEYAFNYYLMNISKAQVLYGTIGVFLGLLIWLYLIAMVVFLGAEIVHLESSRRMAADST